MSRRKQKRGKKSSTANVSISAAQSTATQSPSRSQGHGPRPHRSPLVVILEGFGVLAAIATIVAGTGYAMEKWQETIATVDFSGEIDQAKPFSLPLVVKNPSSIFSVHLPRIDCWVDVEYVGQAPQTDHVFMAADERGVAGPEIPPNGTDNFFCKMPDALGVHHGTDPNGPLVPIKQADMLIAIDYETWIPWTISRRTVSQFVMLPTNSGFRWIKGQWAGGQPGVIWPPGREPPWIREKPKP